MTNSQHRALGIIRVSERHGRDGDRYHSPDIQRGRIERDCANHNLRLLDVLDEQDVSGGKPLAERKQLSRALAAVEAGQVDAIVFAYRDRVDRSIAVNSELCRRMDAKGALLIADGKIITHSTHDGWRHATLESFLNEDQKRAVGAKMRDVQEKCVREGRAPFPVPPGYRKDENGMSEFDPATKDLVIEAWQMRAAKTSMPVIRRWLADNGIRMSLGGLTRLLSNRFYLGELHYRREGVEPNLTAHPPLIDRRLFDKVQRTKGQAGRPSTQSPALLARLGVLRCESCGGRMSLSTKGANGQGGKGAFYRCTSPDCDLQATISADLVEGWVRDRVQELRNVKGGAGPEDAVQVAADELERAQSAFDDAVGALKEFAGEASVVEKLRTLRKARDDAEAAHDEAQSVDGALRVALTVGDWDLLTLEEQRGLVSALVASVTVRRGGRGVERLTITPA